MWVKLVLISVLIFVMNIPFGYWRANVRKFSLQWALAIHLPVPFIILLRIYSEVGFQWFTYVFFVSAFFLGQRIGAIVHRRMKSAGMLVSSNLLRDLFTCRSLSRSEN